MLDIVVLYKFHLKKFKGNILVLILIIAVVFASFSQNSIGIGIATPDPSALLEVSTTDKGFLLPRMRNTEMNAISSPSEGLMVYCLDCILEGIYVYDGEEFRHLIFFENIVKGLAISNLSIPRGSTSNISPTLTPTEATAVYSLIDPPAGVSISTDGTTVSIATDMPIGEHDITVKARGTGNYTGEAQTTFILNIPPIPLISLSLFNPNRSFIKGARSFNISPTLMPNGATAVYSLITPPAGVSISTNGNTVSIATNTPIGEYNITVKARGTGNYNGEAQTTFILNIARIPLTGINLSNTKVIRGRNSFNITPILTPNGATATYSLTGIIPTNVSISGTRISIPRSMWVANYTITVKATGTGDYIGERQTSFRLDIISRIPLTGINLPDTEVVSARPFFPDAIVVRARPFFDISPSLTPDGATATYSLINPPTDVSINGTRISIPRQIQIGNYTIKVMATGTGDYIGDAETTFRLYIIARIPLTRIKLSEAVINISRGTRFFNITPILTPNGATAVYSLIDPPTNVSISGTRISIPRGIWAERTYIIKVKATGTGDYTGYRQTTFTLNISH